MADNGARTSSASKKASRNRTLAKQPERKIRHILKRNGLRQAYEWADKFGHTLTLRKVRPLYSEELRALGERS